MPRGAFATPPVLAGALPGLRAVFAPVLAALVALTLACGPALAEIRFGGGDGRAVAHAVVILGAESDYDGVQAEYAWLAAQYPGYVMEGQSLLYIGSRPFDLLQFRHQGRQLQVYFDISGFFGKN